MALNRRGIVFSIIALALAFLFTIVYATTYEQPLDARSATTETRVKSIDNSISELRRYSSEAISMAGYEALLQMSKEMRGSRTPFVDFNSSFEDCTWKASTCTNNKNLEKLMTLFAGNASNSLHTSYVISVTDLRLIKEDTWTFTVRANFSVLINDSFASWLHKFVQVGTVSIIGVPDPSWEFIGLGVLPQAHPIIPSYLQETEWDIEHLHNFIRAGQYRASSTGVCLSSRFTMSIVSGKNAKHCGIESIVDPEVHTGLKDHSSESFLHLDHQILANITGSCSERVGICGVDKYVTLSITDATRFSMDKNDWWCYSDTEKSTTAFGCPGFP